MSDATIAQLAERAVSLGYRIEHAVIPVKVETSGVKTQAIRVTLVPETAIARFRLAAYGDAIVGLAPLDPDDCRGKVATKIAQQGVHAALIEALKAHDENFGVHA